MSYKEYHRDIGRQLDVLIEECEPYQIAYRQVCECNNNQGCEGKCNTAKQERCMCKSVLSAIHQVIMTLAWGMPTGILNNKSFSKDG